VEIARHIRDETAQKLDTRFDEIRNTRHSVQNDHAKPEASCCTATSSGKSCC
jgi:hypothetical protein